MHLPPIVLTQEQVILLASDGSDSVKIPIPHDLEKQGVLGFPLIVPRPLNGAKAMAISGQMVSVGTEAHDLLTSIMRDGSKALTLAALPVSHTIFAALTVPVFDKLAKYRSSGKSTDFNYTLKLPSECKADATNCIGVIATQSIVVAIPDGRMTDADFRRQFMLDAGPNGPVIRSRQNLKPFNGMGIVVKVDVTRWQQALLSPACRAVLESAPVFQADENVEAVCSVAALSAKDQKLATPLLIAKQRLLHKGLSRQERAEALVHLKQVAQNACKDGALPADATPCSAASRMLQSALSNDPVLEEVSNAVDAFKASTRTAQNRIGAADACSAAEALDQMIVPAVEQFVKTKVIAAASSCGFDPKDPQPLRCADFPGMVSTTAEFVKGWIQTADACRVNLARDVNLGELDARQQGGVAAGIEAVLATQEPSKLQVLLRIDRPIGPQDADAFRQFMAGLVASRKLPRSSNWEALIAQVTSQLRLQATLWEKSTADLKTMTNTMATNIDYLLLRLETNVKMIPEGQRSGYGKLLTQVRSEREKTFWKVFETNAERTAIVLKGELNRVWAEFIGTNNELNKAIAESFALLPNSPPSAAGASAPAVATTPTPALETPGFRPEQLSAKSDSSAAPAAHQDSPTEEQASGSVTRAPAAS